MITNDEKNSLIINSKVLLVDDVTKNLQLLGTILQETGFQVAIAKSGKQALAVVENKPPDLILLDISMPEMDGYEVCEILKQKPETAEIPIIFLTAKTEVEDVIKGFEVGGVDYITKPFNPRELIKRVVTHLELKHSREILKQLNNALSKANEDKEKFLSIISHDLKSPFHGLLGIAQIVKENYEVLPKEDVKDYIDLLYEGLHNQFRFLENILQWGRMQRGRFDFEPSLFHIDTLIEEVINALKINAEHKGINLTFFTGNRINVYSDRNMIREVLQNVVSNAIKFTNKGGIISISLVDMNDVVKIQIQDTGIGISEANKSRLFKIDKIFTTNGTNSEPGTGLGLVLTKEMVEKNKGSIEFESEKGKGTLVSITLPKSEN